MTVIIRVMVTKETHGKLTETLSKPFLTNKCSSAHTLLDISCTEAAV